MMRGIKGQMGRGMNDGDGWSDEQRMDGQMASYTYRTVESGQKDGNGQFYQKMIVVHGLIYRKMDR